jgi:Ca2+/Na+ antiporter
VTEYHGGPKCLTRAALRSRFVPTTILINLVTLSLLAYHELHAGHLDYWMVGLYLLFVLFLVNRARRLKSRVAEIVDLAAYRAGLQRIARKRALSEVTPAKIEPAAEAVR